MFKLVYSIVAFVTWRQQTSWRRFVGVIGAVMLGALVLEALMFLLGFQIKVTSSLFPKKVAGIFGFVIYYIWAIALWKMVSFFSKKPERDIQTPKPEPVSDKDEHTSIKLISFPDYDVSMN